MVYQDDDPNDEKTLERELQLLCAARLGESGLRARPSIHINYNYLQPELGREVKEEMESLTADITNFLSEDSEGSISPSKITFSLADHTQDRAKRDGEKGCGEGTAKSKGKKAARATKEENADAGIDDDGNADAGDDMSVEAKWVAAIAIGRKTQQKTEVKRKKEMGATEVEDANAGTDGNRNTDAGDEEPASKKPKKDASGEGNAGA